MENEIVTTKPKPFCFVLIPFDKSFDDTYNLGIKESCKEAGTYCEKVDEQIFEGSIVERIYNQISKADIIIADMTGRNPNVFYEVGYAHALGKPTILLTKKDEDIPFDLKHYTHIIYENIIGLKPELTKRIEFLINKPLITNRDNQINIDLFVDNKNLLKEDVIYYFKKNRMPNIEITIYNKSYLPIGNSDYKIGIITNEFFDYCYYNINDIADIIFLPNGKLLFMLKNYKEDLFPNSYEKINIYLRFDNKIIKEINEIIEIRLFTIIGTRDYKLRIKEKE